MLKLTLVVVVVGLFRLVAAPDDPVLHVGQDFDRRPEENVPLCVTRMDKKQSRDTQSSNGLLQDILAVLIQLFRQQIHSFNMVLPRRHMVVVHTHTLIRGRITSEFTRHEVTERKKRVFTVE